MVVFSFNYQNLGCLITFFKNRFFGKIVAKSGQLFDSVQGVVRVNQRSTGVDRTPSIVKEKLLGKKCKKSLLSYLKGIKMPQTSRKVFADRTEQFKKTNFEVELKKFVDSFLDAHGSYTSN